MKGQLSTCGFATATAIRQASTNALRRVYVNSMSEKYREYDEICSRWYVTVAPLNDVALSSLKDAVEQLKASPKWKKKGIRKSCEDAQRLARKYEELLYNNVKNGDAGDVRQYLMDFMDSWQDGVKQDVMILRISISNALLRMHYRWDVELASWVFTAFNMLNIAARCYNAYFRGVEKAVGKDYSKAFYEGRMDRVRDAFKVAASSFDPNNEYRLDKDEMCLRSVKVIVNRFCLDDTSIHAGDSALELNPEIEEKSVEVKNAIEARYDKVEKELAKRVGL